MKRILLISTPVGALGSGVGGGVEYAVQQVAKGLSEADFRIDILCPKGSKTYVKNCQLIQLDGQLQVSRQIDPTSTYRKSPLLEKVTSFITNHNASYTCIINFAYDSPIYELTPLIKTPILHYLSMCSMSPEMDDAVLRISSQFPKRIGIISHSQIQTYPKAHSDNFYFLSAGINLEDYSFCNTPKKSLAWAGRISPEKGLEDAFYVAQETLLPLKVMGPLQDLDYWQSLQQDYPHATVRYLGHLDTAAFQSELRVCSGLLMTARWVEAFGRVVIEAMACGVPVIAYRMGGPSEIIRDGITGYLVKPFERDTYQMMAKKLDRLDRYACREDIESRFSTERFISGVLDWVELFATV